jgi:hypothetical protein
VVRKTHCSPFFKNIDLFNFAINTKLKYSGNLERECFEESCTQSEFAEVFDDLFDEIQWTKYVGCVSGQPAERDERVIEKIRICFQNMEVDESQQGDQSQSSYAYN